MKSVNYSISFFNVFIKIYFLSCIGSPKLVFRMCRSCLSMLASHTFHHIL